MAVSDQEAPALRARIVSGLVRHQRQLASRVLAAIGRQDKLPSALVDVWREYVHDAGHARRVGEFRRLASEEDPAFRELGYAVLLALETNPNTPAKARLNAERAIESAWSTPRGAASLLRTIGRTDAVNYAFQVRNYLKDEHREVKEAAAFAAARLNLDDDMGGADRGPKIASIPFESVLAAAATEKGDAKLGERLFQRRGASPATRSPPVRPRRGRRCSALPTVTSVPN